MANTLALGASAERLRGSSPLFRTNTSRAVQARNSLLDTPLPMSNDYKPRRRSPLFEIIVLIGLGLIFGLTYWQYKGAQRDLQQHQQEMQGAPAAK